MILRRALQDAVAEGLLARNPADLVKAPPQRRPELRVLDDEQARLFLREARRSSPHYALYHRQLQDSQPSRQRTGRAPRRLTSRTLVHKSCASNLGPCSWQIPSPVSWFGNLQCTCVDCRQRAIRCQRLDAGDAS